MFGEAIARSYGLAPGWFIATFKGKQKVAVRDGVAGEPFCGALAAFLLDRPGGFVGTFTELRTALEPQLRSGHVDVPKSGQAGQLMRDARSSAGAPAVSVTPRVDAVDHTTRHD